MEIAGAAAQPFRDARPLPQGLNKSMSLENGLVPRKGRKAPPGCYNSTSPSARRPASTSANTANAAEIIAHRRSTWTAL
ncbi:hypothetical protein DMX06_11440 [Pseudomonas mosselii]|nr:hypothetical protein DMX06_11440 [Pseudomonas mosselii]